MDRMTPPQELQPDRLAMALDRELRPGERIRWQGRQLPRISSKGFGIYLFAIPWTAFSLFWTAMASVGASEMQEESGWLSWAFPLFGVPFVVIGFFMLSSPFMPLFNKGKVLYAVTNQRLIKLRLGKSIDIDSIPAKRIGAIKRNEQPDGSGSLKVAVSVGRDSDGDQAIDYFEMGEVQDILSAHDHIAELGRSADRES